MERAVHTVSLCSEPGGEGLVLSSTPPQVYGVEPQFRSIGLLHDMRDPLYREELPDIAPIIRNPRFLSVLPRGSATEPK